MGSQTTAEDTSPVNDSASDTDGRVIGGRATKEQIYLIDRAALEMGMARGPFLVSAAVEAARTVLATKATLNQPAEAA